MPTELIPTSINPLQRELADSIIRMVPLDELRILLACGAKVNEQVTQGLMPLHYAIWQQYYEAAQLLLTRGGDINAVDECGYSALHLAAEHGFLQLVRMLLSNGAKVDYRPNTDEQFPRTTQCDEPLRLAIRNKHMEIARILLEHGADPNKRYFFGSEINLVNDIDFLELLLVFGADPDSRDRSGLTPLMKAARRPHGLQSVLLLLKYGADINAMADERHDFRTVLHYAVLSGNIDTIRLLVKQGSRLNYDEVYDIRKPSPLDLAILQGSPKMVALLIASGANVNCSSPLIGTPLHVASADNIDNRYEILKMLLEKGADPNHKAYGEADDLTTQLRPVLVEYVASNAQPDPRIVNLLLQYGARVVMKTQFRDPDGILNSLQNVSASAAQHNAGANADADDDDMSANDIVFHLLLEASESFDSGMIRRNQLITREQKQLLLRMASNPLPLRHQVRLYLRRLLGNRLIDAVGRFELPQSLCNYLKFLN